MTIPRDIKQLLMRKAVGDAGQSGAGQSDAPGAAELPREHYYRAARQWDTDRLRALEVSRNRAYVALLACLLAISALAWAVVTLVAARKVEVVTIAFDENTNSVRHVRYSDDVARLTAREGFVQNQAYQFIQALETWDGNDAAQRWRLVFQMADPKLHELLRQMLQQSAATLGRDRNLRRAAKVHSISFLNPNTLHIQFATDDEVPGQTLESREWAVVMGFRFSGQAASVEDAMVNPFGFQVTSYRKNDTAYKPK